MRQPNIQTASGARAACAVFILFSLLLLAGALWHEDAERQSEAEQQVANTSQHLAEQLNDNLRDTDLTFDHLESTPWLAQWLRGTPLTPLQQAQLQNQLRLSMLRIPLLGQIQIVDYTCRLAFSTDDIAPPAPALRQSRLCQWLKSKGHRAARRDTEIGGQQQNLDIVHAVKLQDAQHNVIGMAIATYPQSTIINAMNALDVGEHGEIWVQDRHNHLLLHRASLTATVNKISLNTLAPELVQQDDHQQIFRAPSPLDKLERLYSLRPLESYPLRVAVGRLSQDSAPTFSARMAAYFMIWLLLVAVALRLTYKQRALIAQTQRLLDNAKQLHASEAQIKLLLETIPVAALLVEPDDLHIHYANPHARAMLGLDDKQTLVPKLDDSEADLHFTLKPLSDWLQSGRAVEDCEVEIEREDHCKQWVLASFQTLSLSQHAYSLVTLQDRSEIKALDQALQEKARQIEILSGIDPLTQLANRHCAEQILHNEVIRCQRYGQPLSLAYLDLDLFRSFNERHGHEAGDNVLIAIAEELKNATRSTDTCARMGGEEFMVIFTNTPIKYAYKVMERMRRKIEGTIMPISQESISFSGGITSWRLGDTSEEMQNRADSLLRQAKSTGRNRLVCDE